MRLLTWPELNKKLVRPLAEPACRTGPLERELWEPGLGTISGRDRQKHAASQSQAARPKRRARARRHQIRHCEVPDEPRYRITISPTDGKQKLWRRLNRKGRPKIASEESCWARLFTFSRWSRCLGPPHYGGRTTASRQTHGGVFGQARRSVHAGLNKMAAGSP